MYHIPSIKLMIVRDGSVQAEKRKIAHPADAHAMLSAYYSGHDREEFLVMLMDAKNRITGINTVSIGSLSIAIVHPREVFKAAIIGNAAGIILAHNHPSGDPTPSREDVTLTHRLVKAGELIGIPVLDHLIVGDAAYYSFSDNGTLKGAWQ